MRGTQQSLWKLMVVVGAIALVTPRAALALDAVEATVIGDMGPYWFTPAEARTFAHRLPNIDSRVIAQLGAPNVALTGPLYNVVDEQLARGGGFSLPVGPLHMGIWIQQYAPSMSDFMTNAVASIAGWGDADYDDPNDELAAIDPRLNGGSGLNPLRKADLFFAYWFEPLQLETGARLWYGSTFNALEGDDSTGQIGINTDDDGTTGTNGADENLAVDTSKYVLREMGVSLSAGWRGIPGLRVDAALDVGKLGAGWRPNGLDDYVDAGGLELGFHARSHYELTREWTVGGFFQWMRQSMSATPLRDRDGGALKAYFNGLDPDQAGSLADPSRASQPEGDPALAGEDGPVKGMTYSEWTQRLQLAALAQFRPNSRATLYSALGWDMRTAGDKLAVDNDAWYDEQKSRLTALPFLHLGMTGRVFSWLDLMMGATKHWASVKNTHKAYDARIPDNGDARGPAGTAPAAGSDDTNARRREIEEFTANDASTTTLLLGTRLHYEGLQITGHLNPAFLLNGSYVLSGTAAPVWAFISVTYDWDFDSDVEGGNGTMPYVSPIAETAPASAPQAAVAPAPVVTPAPAAPAAAPASKSEDSYVSPFGSSSGSGAAPANTPSGSGTSDPKREPL